MEGIEEEPAVFATATEPPAVDEAQAPPGKEEPPSILGLLLLAGDLHDDITEGASFPQFQVVAVHGLYGHRVGTWTTDAIGEEPGTSWMTEQIYKQHKNAQVWTYGYNASINRTGISTRTGIRQKALDLLETLVEMRKNWGTKPIPLAFVAHDLGGTIVKEALLIAAREYKKYRNILEWTRLLMFFGCPHQCKSTENMGDSLARLLFYEGVQPIGDAGKPTMEIASKKFGNYFVRAAQMGTTDLLRELGSWVNEINGSFYASNIPSLLRILNIYSNIGDPIAQVFREFTACMDISYEGRFGVTKPHTRLGQITQKDVDKALRNRIDTCLKILHMSSAWESGDASPEWLRTLRSLAAPLPPLVVPLGDQALLDWILLDETYTTWLETDGPGVLHIHGTTRSSKVAKYLFQVLSSRHYASLSTELPIYFSFDRYDDRRNSILGMLNTVLAQVCSHDIAFADQASGSAEKMTLNRSWSEAELIIVLRVFLLSLASRSMIYILDGFDECDASALSFFKDFCHFTTLTEHRFKVVFASRTRSDIQSILASCPTINVDQNIDPETLKINRTYDIDVEYMGLLCRRPLYAKVGSHIRDILLKFSDDDEHRSLITRELLVAKYLLSEQEVLDQLDILTNSTPHDIFRRIMEKIPDHRRPWARRILSWTLFAFHPLTILELAAAVETDIEALQDAIVRRSDDLVYYQFAEDLEEFFAGMFVVRNCEVHFGHREARSFFLENVDQGQPWYDVKDTAHKDIANLCLTYLSLPWARFSIDLEHDTTADGAWDSSVFVTRTDISLYAVRYWPKHYKLIPKTHRPTAPAIQFFENTTTMRWWAEAYWWISNAISRVDYSCISLLPLFAALGLDDLVEREFENTRRPQTIEFSLDRALALVEASRNAQSEIIRQLLEFGDYTPNTQQAALCAAASSGNEACLMELVNYAAQSAEKFDWPAVLLCRAAEFRQEGLVKKLLEFGASPNAVIANALTALHIAARDGHADIVKILLDAKADYKLVTDSGRVALHLAAYHGHTDIVKKLLVVGSEVNALDNEKANALHLASLWGNYGTIEVLLEAGSDVGNDKKDEWTPLTIVVDEGYVKSARLLVENKANVEVEGVNGKTPLRYAALRESLKLCKLLIENGANVNTSGGGGPILNFPANDGNLDIVKLFVENGARVNDANTSGWNPLHNAAVNGHVSVLAYLLDHGADLHQKIENGYHAFLIAVTSNHPEAVKLLIDRGADVNAIDVDGWYPVHLAYNHAPTMQVLLEAGADPSIMGNNSSALYLASYYDKADVVEALLKYNPKLEFTPPVGSNWTALSAASSNGHPEVVRLLLEAGANVNHKSKLGEMPLQYAVSNGREDIVDIIMEFRPNLHLQDNIGDTALNSFNEEGETSISMIRSLLNGGSDIETRSNTRETPLCRAVRFEKLELVKYLISRKANLNAKGTKFGGPLHIACRWNNFEITEMLVKSGADVDLVDEESSAATPLQSAFRGFAENGEYDIHEKIVKCLLEEGKADVKVVGGLQGCALNAACGWSKPEMVNLMLEKGAEWNVADGTGRVAIHFAASHTLEHFQQIQSAGADLEVVDKTKRTVVHWAAISGRPDMLERVLSLSRGKVDQPDIDGWTPLLWAARGIGTYLNRATDAMTEEVIKILLERGANPCVIVKGLDRDWTPIKLARYHGVGESVIDLLTSKTKEKLEAERKTFDESLHASKEGMKQAGSCDSCLSPMYGLVYECTICLDFDFCFKCYGTRHLIHADHIFKVSETEWLEIPVDEKKSDEDDDTDDDTDDSDGDDDTKKIEVNGEPEKEKENDTVVENGTGEEEEDSDTEDEG
ncbi:ankyrin [Stipitochalara longipes BDJ]|nr:ankyrin [Stipitochalara longipes BDJ]